MFILTFCITVLMYIYGEEGRKEKIIGKEERKKKFKGNRDTPLALRVLCIRLGCV